MPFLVPSVAWIVVNSPFKEPSISPIPINSVVQLKPPSSLKVKLKFLTNPNKPS